MVELKLPTPSPEPAQPNVVGALKFSEYRTVVCADEQGERSTVTKLKTEGAIILGRVFIIDVYYT
jgi:hypothetical protein